MSLCGGLTLLGDVDTAVHDPLAWRLIWVEREDQAAHLRGPPRVRGTPRGHTHGVLGLRLRPGEAVAAP
jgi:hypothetical protein